MLVAYGGLPQVRGEVVHFPRVPLQERIRPPQVVQLVEVPGPLTREEEVPKILQQGRGSSSW